jgi:hypothetical protein
LAVALTDTPRLIICARIDAPSAKNHHCPIDPTFFGWSPLGNYSCRGSGRADWWLTMA